MSPPSTVTPIGALAALDALLPPEMAKRAENVGVAKAAMDGTRVAALAVLAGAFVAFGAVFATVALAGTVGAPWGPARVLAGVVFSLGLVLVLVGGAELFTGNNLIAMAWAAGRVTTRQLARNWLIVFSGNFAGALGVAALVFAGRTHEAGGGAFGVTALTIAAGKLELGFAQAIALGVLCNVLVCLAVWLTFSARTTTDRIVAIVLPVSAFVAAGFEHSIANMYFVPFALFVVALDPGFAAAHGLGAQAGALTWTRFLVGNLLPVTIGNVVGGTILVGVAYWFVYLKATVAGSASEPVSRATRS